MRRRLVTDELESELLTSSLAHRWKRSICVSRRVQATEGSPLALGQAIGSREM
jgi:hypothetical protein